LGKTRSGVVNALANRLSVWERPTIARGVLKASIVASTIGGGLAVVEGLLLIVLGNLADLAENPAGETAIRDGYVALALGVIVLTAVFVTRRRPLLLAAATAAAAALGFLVENALWIFAAGFLFAAAALGIMAHRSDLRSAGRDAGFS
jgi:hypothetical protein